MKVHLGNEKKAFLAVAAMKFIFSRELKFEEMGVPLTSCNYPPESKAVEQSMFSSTPKSARVVIAARRYLAAIR